MKMVIAKIGDYDNVFGVLRKAEADMAELKAQGYTVTSATSTGRTIKVFVWTLELRPA